MKINGRVTSHKSMPIYFNKGAQLRFVFEDNYNFVNASKIHMLCILVRPVSLT